ncbi:MAG: eukaryotic-like serine/threonine-protein kinase [Actinoplanes sp.]|nr:eukaryotic-like serine/threonine-protein kinase [Actinoplanes sp.]
MLSSGHLLDNRYRLDERIATGGMGDVWRGTDVVLGRVVAVKVLRTAMLTDPEFAARFYGEARMMAAFRHPGVVEVYDYASAGDLGGEDQVAYLVMAFVDGEPLSARLKAEGCVPIAETMSIVAQAAEALHAAHQNGTVHRDVKPGNLIVKPNGTVILVDFGVARSAAVTSVTGLNAIVGTALYMAPEQVAKGNVTPATDIYALGAVAYHCIAGRPPFDGDNALQVALRHLEDDPDPLPDDVPPPVRALIGRAMAKDPDDRFGTAAEFAAAAMAAAGPMDWRSLTGTQQAAPLSPAAPTRVVPMPRDTTLTSRRNTLTPIPATGPGTRGRAPRSQIALGVAVAFLFLLAIGLAVAIRLAGSTNSDNAVTPNDVPSTATSDGGNASATTPLPRTTPTIRASRANGVPQSVLTPTTTPPTTTPPTTTPTTKPTTKPTTPPTTTPTTPPTTTPTSPAGAGAGGGEQGSGG